MSTWLQKLRSTELHRLAVLLGTPCSGTKAVKIKGIEDALKSTRNVEAPSNNVDSCQSNGEIRLFSIDMGVKNLAYAYFTATSSSTTTTTHSKLTQDLLGSQQLRLEEWQKFDISAPASSPVVRNDDNDDDDDNSTAKVEGLTTVEAESHAYHPSLYAGRAYRFVQSILQRDPTHIIIERQRFRSGGGPVVQEWSIRVGIFEAMLWAVLRTLQEQSRLLDQNKTVRKLPCEIEGILPARVNRFWFESQTPMTTTSTTAAELEDVNTNEMGSSISARTNRLSGKDMKKAKVKLVMSMLDAVEEQKDALPSLVIDDSQHMQDAIGAFRRAYGPAHLRKGEQQRVTTKRKPLLVPEQLKEAKVNKLDDLADCLLQGMAWWNWRNNKRKVLERGEAAFDLKL